MIYFTYKREIFWYTYIYSKLYLDHISKKINQHSTTSSNREQILTFEMIAHFCHFLVKVYSVVWRYDWDTFEFNVLVQQKKPDFDKEYLPIEETPFWALKEHHKIRWPLCLAMLVLGWINAFCSPSSECLKIVSRKVFTTDDN